MINKPVEEESSFFKPSTIIFSLLAIISVILGFKTIEYLAVPSLADVAAMTCEATEYRIVKIADETGISTMNMYVYSWTDEVSDLVASRSGLPGNAFRNFYTEYLCNSSAEVEEERCQGIILDVGAHLGVHSLFLGKSGFQVHAFEPFRATAELLRCSAVANNYDIQVVSEGVSNETGEECIFFPMTAQSQAAMFVPKGMGSCADTNQSVPVVTLDHYWENVLNKQHVLFVRVDVMGHEALVLEGATKMMADSPPEYMTIHYNPAVLGMKSVDIKEFIKAVYAAQYRIYDCQQKVELKDDYRGDSVLQEYKDTGLSTDLLLVQDALFTGDLPDFRCGY